VGPLSPFMPCGTGPLLPFACGGLGPLVALHGAGQLSLFVGGVAGL